MDQNTPDLLLPPPLISLSLLSISAASRGARAPPCTRLPPRRHGAQVTAGLPAGGEHPRPAAAAPPAARRPGGPLQARRQPWRTRDDAGSKEESSRTACRQGGDGPARRHPPSPAPSLAAPYLPPRRSGEGAWRAGGGLARARARRAAACGRAQLRRPGSRWPANGVAEPRGGLATAAR
ncbi:hypothetical protein PVAP13_4NG334650 [Panicum virgatum]|uniref:Uncharacterized protein n=1 Tax=Panicum virgatum TaxID=38727 RepID=A0A8T0TCH1_PANVG|nr:hypothetical protein PVAP13_4NG334650 [Panicum virgatum]